MPYIELEVLNNAPEPILGIDLGTTNSLCAMFVDGRPAILRTESHSGVVPSAVRFDATGLPTIGQEARKSALVHPERVIFSFKRFMGRRLEDCADDLRNVPFPAEETEHGVLRFQLPGGRTATPEQLSALVLERVHQIACKVSETEAPRRCVVTVPAYFDDAQRQATRDAARLAGLEAVRIVNEPTAACLAYGLDTKQEGTVAVYDLGGGTFDVSILTIEEGVFRVLATAGDTHLGGDDVDRALLAIAEDALRDQVDDEKWQDAAFRQGLRLAAERCKIELSYKPIGDFHVVDADTGLDWRRGVRREEFDALVAPLIDRTLDLCRRALADAGVETGGIDEVVLVGGSTRIPAVREAVERFFGRAPHAELNPDEVVALGAAVQGHILAGGTRDVLLMDVTPLSLGLETLGGAVAKIIHRNSPIPCADKEGFTTHVDDQTGIDFHVVQGERELAKDCRSLGRFKLTGIPPMPAGMPRVGVRFALDANGMLTVTAKEESTGAEARIEVEPSGNLTDEQVETMLQESFDLAQEDFDARRIADLQVEVATMVRASETNLPRVADQLDKESVQDIEEAVAAAAAVRDAAPDALDVAAVQEARDRLEQATLPLAAALMDAVAKQALSGKSLEEV